MSILLVLAALVIVAFSVFYIMKLFSGREELNSNWEKVWFSRMK